LKMKNGFVALVGAGPGEIGLLTLRGKELIEKADVVVYDRLVSDDILQIIPPSAERIDVGKESSKHLVAQKEINRILLAKAMDGKFVVRLKGGDPFLFGRGAEELELLEQNQISFEVVPGITSAISAPSFAGIPVTHRDFCSSVQIITGHQKENEPLKINFEAIVRTGGTMIFLMGVSSIRNIADGLILAGMNKNTPAAVIENGTRPSQRKMISNIGSLYEESIRHKIKSPSIIIVGDVCKLSEKYDWFSQRLLFGKKIVVTRPKASEGTLSKQLKELGADVFDYPCIEIKEIMEKDQLNEIIADISAYSWLLFTSKNGVDIFFSYLKHQKQDLRILSSCKIAAIGNQTAKALSDYGIIADYVPEIYDGKHLGEGICKITSSSDRILLLRALKGNEEITDYLKANGRQCRDVAVYDTVYLSENPGKMKQVINETKDLLVTFTSASTVEGFINASPDVDLSGITGICIGNQTARMAEKYGIKHHVSDEATIESMIEKIIEVQNERNKA